jgi:hypothetical protein
MKPPLVASILLSALCVALLSSALAAVAAVFAFFRHDLILKVAVGGAAMFLGVVPPLTLLARLRLLRSPLGAIDVGVVLLFSLSAPFVFAALCGFFITTFTGLQLTPRIIPAIAIAGGGVFTILGAIFSLSALGNKCK